MSSSRSTGTKAKAKPAAKSAGKKPAAKRSRSRSLSSEPRGKKVVVKAVKGNEQITRELLQAFSALTAAQRDLYIASMKRASERDGKALSEEARREVNGLRRLGTKRATRATDASVIKNDKALNDRLTRMRAEKYAQEEFVQSKAYFDKQVPKISASRLNGASAEEKADLYAARKDDVESRYNAAWSTRLKGLGISAGPVGSSGWKAAVKAQAKKDSQRRLAIQREALADMLSESGVQNQVARLKDNARREGKEENRTALEERKAAVNKEAERRKATGRGAPIADADKQAISVATLRKRNAKDDWADANKAAKAKGLEKGERDALKRAAEKAKVAYYKAADAAARVEAKARGMPLGMLPSQKAAEKSAGSKGKKRAASSSGKKAKKPSSKKGKKKPSSKGKKAAKKPSSKGKKAAKKPSSKGKKAAAKKPAAKKPASKPKRKVIAVPNDYPAVEEKEEGEISDNGSD